MNSGIPVGDGTADKHCCFYGCVGARNRVVNGITNQNGMKQYFVITQLFKVNGIGLAVARIEIGASRQRTERVVEYLLQRNWGTVAHLPAVNIFLKGGNCCWKSGELVRRKIGRICYIEFLWLFNEKKKNWKKRSVD